MPISKKLILVYSIVLLLIAIIIVQGITGVMGLRDIVDKLVNEEFKTLDLVLEVRTLFVFHKFKFNSYLLSGNPADRDDFFKREKDFRDLVEKTKKAVKTAEEKRLIDKIDKTNEKLDQSVEKSLQVYEKTGDGPLAYKSIPVDMSDQIDEQIFQLEQLVEQGAEERVNEVRAGAGRVINNFLVFAAVLLVVLVSGGVWVFRDFSALAGKITDGSAQLSSSSAEIAAASEEMSQGVESQLAQVVDTSSAMEEMSSSIREVSESAKGASEATAVVSDRVRENTGKMKDTIDGVKSASAAINKLKARSEEIGKVIRLISEIAAQTNILALNAAIEAARAGEYGKGFDVVAEEIRKLAQRTAQSTAEIAPMIEEIQKETQATADAIREKVELAAEVGVNFDAMAEGIMSATTMTKSISTAATQQAKTAEQIADSLQVIASVSQETAKNADETASATHDLAELAQRLREVVKQLKAA